ncbi:uncharacterized protein LOC129309485 [Prosopis cineraria]|uniref:uncharacterized protein LOC129309485 n=1 Tax=Prosopis cineraria TaxID=364024 RepID=UPI00240FF712|nr:uncharacterized protein LOC129309485 [Prosopis cineraria]
MGLLGKSLGSKFKDISKQAVSRTAILKNKFQVRGSYARSDVVQFLDLGYHDRALLRVEQLIREQNMVDVFVMIENYCNFLRGRAKLLEKNSDCPEEIKEATSSLIFASSRCGEFPELQKIREIFTFRYGEGFAAHAVELHQNNRVNSKMILKLSATRPAMEIRLKVLKDIAAEIGVTLQLEQHSKLTNVNKLSDEYEEEEHERKKTSNGTDNYV